MSISFTKSFNSTDAHQTLIAPYCPCWGEQSLIINSKGDDSMVITLNCHSNLTTIVLIIIINKTHTGTYSTSDSIEKIGLPAPCLFPKTPVTLPRLYHRSLLCLHRLEFHKQGSCFILHLALVLQITK